MNPTLPAAEAAAVHAYAALRATDNDDQQVNGEIYETVVKTCEWLFQHLSEQAGEKPDFGAWWFINGGMIHSDWKYKRYSAIRDAAMSLPKRAWDECYAQDAAVIAALQANINRGREEIAALKAELEGERVWHKHWVAANEEINRLRGELAEARDKLRHVCGPQE